jgi:hypothetical protein
VEIKGAEHHNLPAGRQVFIDKCIRERSVKVQSTGIFVVANGITTSLRSVVIPGGNLAKPKQTRFAVCFIFFMTFTKQVLFGPSKNKTIRLLADGLLCLCGERGIRTPGTVSHTAV